MKEPSKNPVGFVFLTIIVIVFSFWYTDKPIKLDKDIEENIYHPVTYSHTSEYVGEFNGCELYLITITRSNGVDEDYVKEMLMGKCPNGETVSSTKIKTAY